MTKIYTTNDKTQEKFLRKKTREFDFEKRGKKEIDALIREMRAAMHDANGIGLSANQIGSQESVFVAEVPSGGKGTKFYAIFNPKLEESGDEKVVSEEGCLSIPGKYGVIARSHKVVLVGQDARGKKIKIKAWGLLARVFQHEADHLNGKLFVDRIKKH